MSREIDERQLIRTYPTNHLLLHTSLPVIYIHLYSAMPCRPGLGSRLVTQPLHIYVYYIWELPGSLHYALYKLAIYIPLNFCSAGTVRSGPYIWSRIPTTHAPD